MLTVENISIAFSDNGILENVSFTLDDNTCYALTGVSGVGKTTLLNIISGLEKPDSGEITYNSKVFNNKSLFMEPWLRDVGMVFQDLALWPHMTVLDHLKYSINHTKNNNVIEEVLVNLHLNEYMNSLPMQLSGGQQQRLAIGRVLVKQPNIILLDEAFNQLDLTLQKEMWLLFKNYQKQSNCIILLVTHDLYNSKENIDHILTLENKKVILNV